ncbi:hypothetical protein BRARA_C02335 [Brassica rapa]|uniref:SIAH-type domain-containing protein n=1 Tax=Brassica campestris TaxID=3711 RepID=A0A397ZYS1_BRACM|nr:hypothetical protein BRARA_C02335 [Brassica rapa]
MECNSSDSNVSRQKRKRTEDDKTRSAMLDFGVLDCPICIEPLSIPIFQCPSCALPVGHSRCRAMETLLKSVFLPCQNAKYGCTETVAFGKEPTHEKDCTFAEYCCCPVQYCNYAGSYIDLYLHYVSSNHMTVSEQIRDELCIGISCGIKMNISDKILIQRATFVQRATVERLLFAVQCFKEPFGVYVTVSCIAPSIQEVGPFSYRLIYTVDGQTIIYKSSEMKKIREVSLQTPQDNYMLIPHSLLRGELLEMRLCIKMLNLEHHS